MSFRPGSVTYGKSLLRALTREKRHLTCVNFPLLSSPQVLLDGRRRDLGLKILDEGGDMERLHRREFIDGLAGAPSGEAPGGVHIGPAGMIVVNLSCKKLQDALRGFRRGHEERRGLEIRRGREGRYHTLKQKCNEMVYETLSRCLCPGARPSRHPRQQRFAFSDSRCPA